MNTKKWFKKYLEERRRERQNPIYRRRPWRPRGHLGQQVCASIASAVHAGYYGHWGWENLPYHREYGDDWCPDCMQRVWVVEWLGPLKPVRGGLWWDQR